MHNGVVNRRRALVLNAIKQAAARYTNYDKDLLSRLVTLHTDRMPYNGNVNGDLYIHWFYQPRTEDRLTACEIFHLNMLQYFNALDRMETIHIRCATENAELTQSMHQTINVLSKGKAKVDFKLMPRNKSWEHDTFKEATEYAISTGKFVYYTHFKGVTRIGDSSLGIAPRLLKNSTDLDIYYWCYLMYLALFTAPTGVKAIGPLLHLGRNATYRNRDISWSQLCKGGQVFHYCGSFQAFDGTYIKGCLDICNLGDYAARQKTLWIGDPYAVEMFLSMVTLKEDVYSLDVPYAATNGVYSVYSSNRIPQYANGFRRLYNFGGV